MNVKAVAHPHVHAAPPQDCLGAGKVAGPGQFQVVLVARHDGDRKPGGNGHSDIIGSVARMGKMPRQNGLEVKTLRRLRAVKPGPVAGARHQSPGAGPQGIRNRQGRGRPRPVVQCRQNPAYHRRGHQRPCRVMDQNPVDPTPGQRHQRVADGLAARVPAPDDFHPQRGCRTSVVRMDDKDPGHSGKCVQRMGHNRTPGKDLPLLRAIPAGAQPSPCGNNNGGCGHLCNPAPVFRIS